MICAGLGVPVYSWRDRGMAAHRTTRVRSGATPRATVIVAIRPPTVHEADLDDAVPRNRPARAIMATETLDEVEARRREVCG